MKPASLKSRSRNVEAMSKRRGDKVTTPRRLKGRNKYQEAGILSGLALWAEMTIEVVRLGRS